MNLLKPLEMEIIMERNPVKFTEYKGWPKAIKTEFVKTPILYVQGWEIDFVQS